MWVTGRIYESKDTKRTRDISWAVHRPFLGCQGVRDLGQCWPAPPTHPAVWVARGPQNTAETGQGLCWAKVYQKASREGVAGVPM